MAKNDSQILGFEQVIASLLDISTPFPPKYLHRFSDLPADQLALLKKSWLEIDADRRANLIEDLEEVADSDTLVSFDDLARFVIDDPDPRVRVGALRLLYNCENPKMITSFIRMAKQDEDVNVRATACTALGQFIYLGEIEDIPAEAMHRVEENLIQIYYSTDQKLVRRRALEALGFTSREEIDDMINSALKQNDLEWTVSAIFAMGRSANEKWAKEVLAHLDDPNTAVQVEAVRAAGELELAGARERLIEKVEEGIEDEEIRLSAAWSLSQIGGDGVSETLTAMLDDADDDEEEEFIQEALENLAFVDSRELLSLISVDEEDEEPDQIVDLIDDEDKIDDFDEDEEA